MSAVSPNDVWAAGRDFDVPGLDQTLVEHWDGATWSVASSSNVGTGQNLLSGGTALPGGVLWSAGESSADTLGKTMTLKLCEQLVQDTGFSAPNATVSKGSTVAWGFPTANTISHSVSDNTGMGMFDSGLRAPGSSFTFTFVGAGGYKVIDVATSSTTVIKVPVSAIPGNGNISTVFTITWASGSAPTGYIFDVQIKRPGSSTFTNWLTGQTAPSSTFTPDTGTGSYTFRARMHKQGTSSASNWSPTAVITVS